MIHTPNFNLIIYFLLITFFLLIVLILYVLKSKRRKGCYPEPNYYEKVYELNKVLESIGFAYDARQNIFYSTLNPWQKQTGYCRLYDEAAPACNMIIDCEPILFEYDDKKWLIEFWKGQYSIFTGAEVGIYTAVKQDINIPGLLDGDFFMAVEKENYPHISFSLWKDGKLLFNQSARHWWLTGFLLGEYSQPEQLTMHIEMTFDDENLCKAFIKALTATGYSDQDFLVRGSSVWIIYNKPYSEPTRTRYSRLARRKQKMNKLNCKIFKKAVPPNESSVNELFYLKRHVPWLYKKTLHYGTNKKRFKHFKTISGFLNNNGKKGA